VDLDVLRTAHRHGLQGARRVDGGACRQRAAVGDEQVRHIPGLVELVGHRVLGSAHPAGAHQVPSGLREVQPATAAAGGVDHPAGYGRRLACAFPAEREQPHVVLVQLVVDIRGRQSAGVGDGRVQRHPVRLDRQILALNVNQQVTAEVAVEELAVPGTPRGDVAAVGAQCGVRRA
jgi:hypothetical protein